MPRLIPLALLVLCSSSGCGPSPEQDPTEQETTEQADALSPAETVQAMLAAARAGDWESYVDEFYGEADKFRSEADRDALVARFRDQWGAQVIPGLEAASQVEPTLSDDGQRAVFALPDGDFVLYRDAQGKWGFHL